MIDFKSNIIIHFIELKWRIFYYSISFFTTFATGFFYKVEIFYYISKFFLLQQSGFIYTGLTDPLIVYLKLIFFLSLWFTFPLFIYLFGIFILKSFYRIISKLFFGIFFSYYLITLFFFWIWHSQILNLFLTFFLYYQRVGLDEVMVVTLQATLDKYLTLFIYFIIIYLLISYLPLLSLVFILFIENVNPSWITFQLRKYLYGFLLFLILFFLPPDFLVQLLFIILLIFFLEFFIYFILFSYMLYRNFYFSVMDNKKINKE